MNQALEVDTEYARSKFPPQVDGEDRIITEHRDAHTRALDLYQGVAEHLTGWSFTYEISDRSWYGPSFRYKLVCDSNPEQAIDLSFGTYSVQRGKVHVSGYWPRREEHGRWTSPSDVREDSPSINVSLDRGYKVIARQIETRFLPEYVRKIFDTPADAATEMMKHWAFCDAEIVPAKWLKE